MKEKSTDVLPCYRKPVIPAMMMWREALRKAVPTFRKPEEVNKEVDLKEKIQEKDSDILEKSGYKIAAL